MPAGLPRFFFFFFGGGGAPPPTRLVFCLFFGGRGRGRASMMYVSGPGHRISDQDVCLRTRTLVFGSAGGSKYNNIYSISWLSQPFWSLQNKGCQNFWLTPSRSLSQFGGVRKAWPGSADGAGARSAWRRCPQALRPPREPRRTRQWALSQFARRPCPGPTRRLQHPGPKNATRGLARTPPPQIIIIKRRRDPAGRHTPVPRRILSGVIRRSTTRTPRGVRRDDCSTRARESGSARARDWILDQEARPMWPPTDLGWAQVEPRILDWLSRRECI